MYSPLTPLSYPPPFKDVKRRLVFVKSNFQIKHPKEHIITQLAIMMRRTTGLSITQSRHLLNFFPLGRASGPKMIQKVLPPNMSSPRMMKMPKMFLNTEAKTRNYVPRNQLKLHCADCKFYWHHDALAVRCTSNPTHRQREMWLEPTWIKFNRNPLNFHKYLIANIHPRTGAMLNRENTTSRNNERRGAGYSARNLRMGRDSRSIARKVSGVGSFHQGYYLKFPLPT